MIILTVREKEVFFSVLALSYGGPSEAKSSFGDRNTDLNFLSWIEFIVLRRIPFGNAQSGEYKKFRGTL